MRACRVAVSDACRRLAPSAGCPSRGGQWRQARASWRSRQPRALGCRSGAEDGTHTRRTVAGQGRRWAVWAPLEARRRRGRRAGTACAHRWRTRGTVSAGRLGRAQKHRSPGLGATAPSPSHPGKTGGTPGAAAWGGRDARAGGVPARWPGRPGSRQGGRGAGHFPRGREACADPRVPRGVLALHPRRRPPPAPPGRRWPTRPARGSWGVRPPQPARHVWARVGVPTGQQGAPRQAGRLVAVMCMVQALREHGDFCGARRDGVVPRSPSRPRQDGRRPGGEQTCAQPSIRIHIRAST